MQTLNLSTAGDKMVGTRTSKRPQACIPSQNSKCWALFASCQTRVHPLQAHLITCMVQRMHRSQATDIPCKQPSRPVLAGELGSLGLCCLYRQQAPPMQCIQIYNPNLGVAQTLVMFSPRPLPCFTPPQGPHLRVGLGATNSVDAVALLLFHTAMLAPRSMPGPHYPTSRPPDYASLVAQVCPQHHPHVISAPQIHTDLTHPSPGHTNPNRKAHRC